MTKKAKITLILQILLILILVPIGVSFAAGQADTKAFNGINGGETSYYNWFNFSNTLAVEHKGFSSEGYNWDSILQSIKSSAFDVLKNNSRVFCLKNGLSLNDGLYLVPVGTGDSTSEIIYDINNTYYFDNVTKTGMPSKITQQLLNSTNAKSVDINLSEVPIINVATINNTKITRYIWDSICIFVL